MGDVISHCGFALHFSVEHFLCVFLPFVYFRRNVYLSPLPIFLFLGKFLKFIDFFFKREKRRESQRVRERNRNTSVLFHLFMHSLVAF